MCLPRGTVAKPVVCLFVFQGSFAYLLVGAQK